MFRSRKTLALYPLQIFVSGDTTAKQGIAHQVKTRMLSFTPSLRLRFSDRPQYRPSSLEMYRRTARLLTNTSSLRDSAQTAD